MFYVAFNVHFIFIYLTNHKKTINKSESRLEGR
jgi:hypothetical protein